jgi:hypothetical protein
MHAARNIRAKGSVKVPMVGVVEAKAGTSRIAAETAYKPPALAVG